MKVEWHIDPEQEEKVVLHVREKTPALLELERQLLGMALSPIPALRGDRTVLLSPEEVLRFSTDGKGVSAHTPAGSYALKLRLYELEAMLEGHPFARISNSEIVNLKKITALDLSLTGTIRMTLTDGSMTYASRRYVKKIRQALGLERRGKP